MTIAKSLTLKGAGADVVRISPRQSTPGGGQIATANPSLTDGAGDIISVTGTPTTPSTVHISGISVDGDGVYVEAGVVYRDAQGSIAGTPRHGHRHVRGGRRRVDPGRLARRPAPATASPT